jgi:hypothetical protein
MAENNIGSTPPHSGRNPLILAALILLLVAVLGFMYHQNKSGKFTSANLPTNFSEFKSDKYGFGFIYPTNWGKASINEVSVEKGKIYNINFYVSTKEPVAPYFIRMGYGNNSSIITKANLQKQLSRSDFIKKDTSSYAWLDISAGSHVQNALTIDQIVDLPKIKVDAAEIVYFIRGDSTECSTSKFSTSNDGKCITEANYEVVSEVIKSLKSL